MSYVQYGYNSQENSDQELRLGLAKSNAFTAADLQANRQGQISTPQMMKVLYGAVTPLLGLIFPLLGIALLALLVYFFAPYLLHRVRWLIVVGKYFTMALGAIACGLLAILMKSIFASGRLLGAVQDLAAGQAAHEVARVRTSRSDDVEDGFDQFTKRRTLTYHYVLGDRELPVSQQAYEEMNERSYGGWFNVYYTPRSNFLLSIEPASQQEIDGARGEQLAA